MGKGVEGELMTDRPWYIGLLLGTAGWFAGLFLLIFVGALFKPDSGPSALFTGTVLFAAAFGLYRVDRDGAFVSQLALAFSIAGQFAMLFGLHEIFFKNSHGIAGIAFTGLVIQLALVWLMPNSLHRAMSTLFACVAWAAFVRYTLWDQPLWGRTPETVPRGASLPMALAGWAAVWVTIGAALFWLVKNEPAWMAAGREALLRPVTTGLILGLAFATLLSQPLESLLFFREMGAKSGWFAIWPLLSALAALGALTAAFALGRRGLMGVCVLAALLHMSHFYYAMGTTLLVKALIMMAMGVACLVAARQAKA
jgi:hypothetical protein